jgi:hypothetical protein
MKDEEILASAIQLPLNLRSGLPDGVYLIDGRSVRKVEASGKDGGRTSVSLYESRVPRSA